MGCQKTATSDTQEEQFARMANNVVRQAYQKALGLGPVLEAINGQLVEVFSDGSLRAIKALPAPTPVTLRHERASADLVTPTAPFLRMFAGPNGSGKSTITGGIDPSLLGIYVNADEMEKDIRRTGFLDVAAYGVEATGFDVLGFFQQSPFLESAGLADDAASLTFTNGRLGFHDVPVNSYHASVSADFIRQRLLQSKTSFTFETVMSSRDKVMFLKNAKEAGFRVYLYYVATEAPEINISRVATRVRQGGHPVPADKIVSRYHRSIGLLEEAVRYADKAFIFDNSNHDHNTWVAEVAAGEVVETKSNFIPNWITRHLADSLRTPNPL